jgi:hypothetical protein
MDTAILYGLGVSFVSSFVRWRFPALPKWLASGGIAFGIGLIIVALIPNTRPLAAIIGVAGLVAFAVAFELQLAWQPQKPGAPASTPGKPALPTEPQVQTEYKMPSKVAETRPEASLSMRVTRAVPDDSSAVRPPDRTEVEGTRRAALLRKITSKYMLDHDGISSAMMAGLELAPANYLNDGLEKLGEKWRVRSVDGPNAEIEEAKL